jgi:transcriptional regulator with GAF, ATPase, and Fis domain
MGPQEILVGVWREACQHIEIESSTRSIAGLLATRIPLAEILVRRVYWDRRWIETVARGGAASPPNTADSRTLFTPEQCEVLANWSRSMAAGGKAGPVTDRGMLDLLVPAGPRGEVLAGPFGAGDQPSGVLVLVAPSGVSFTEEQARLASLLVEPFSIALENDLRVREIAAQREAAEADKRSLLRRLGRKSLGDAVVGAETGLRGVVDRVELVARSDVPVLIVGETGTGKELVARLIHNRSPRHAGPFIRVNCGAIPSELIDSQLFGHEKGAFTGAIETRQGWFERAHGGTLLLDELGELPLAAQVRLLRILQDGWLERVGGSEPIHVDVRIVAATHRDLAAMAAEGRFREDLWYRIAVFPILLPPLRERREDVAALAAHFAERAATRFGLSLVLPTPEDIALLSSYSWPGNIRELGAVIDRAAILGNGARLDVAKALGGTAQTAAAANDERPKALQPPAAAEILPLDTVVRQHIERALAATHGQVEGRHGAARCLGVNPHTLRARMRKLAIDWTRFRPPPDEP